MIGDIAVFYVGRDKRGNATGGRLTTDDVPGFIASRFKAGWQHLVVTESPEPGEYGPRIGAIEPDAFTGKRTWWTSAVKP